MIPQVVLPLLREGTNGEVTVHWVLSGTGPNRDRVTDSDVSPMSGLVALTSGLSVRHYGSTFSFISQWLYWLVCISQTISTSLWASLRHNFPVLSVFSNVSCHFIFFHIFPGVVNPSPSRSPPSSLPRYDHVHHFS